MKSVSFRSLGAAVVLSCAALVGLAPTVGCGGGGSGGGSGVGTCPPNSDADQLAGEALVAVECRTCHDSSLTGAARNAAPIGVDYDVQSVVLATADEMFARMKDTDFPMPPAGNLSAAEVEQVRVWLACGAK